MRKAFTPNMSPEMVRELDQRRGFGDVGRYTNPSPINRKEPWNVRTPDHTPQAEEIIEPEADPSDGDVNTEATMQSPVKEATQVLKSWLEKSTPPGREDQVKELKGKVENPWAVAWASYNKKNKAISSMSSCKAHGEECDGDHEEAEKALHSRSLYIPPPMQEYDPFGIQRSATTVTTDMLSKLPKPEGFAPAVRHTLDDVSRRDLTIKPYWEQASKSCVIHGILFDVKKGCYPCSVTKAMECDECGSSKVKRPGGVLQCPRGHGDDKDAAY